MDLPNLWLWSGLRIGPQMMDGLSAGRSPPRRKRKGKERTVQNNGLEAKKVVPDWSTESSHQSPVCEVTRDV